MVDKFESEPTSEPRSYYPITQEIIEGLKENPTASFECLFEDGPAVGIYELPGGCVAFPGVETQALCPQHVCTDGSFHGMYPVVDLSIDAAWSDHRGEVPDFYMQKDPLTGSIYMLPFGSRGNSGSSVS